MSAALTASPQVEADKKLIRFQTYEDYLNSLVTSDDHCFLQSTTVSRTIAELGYRSSGETLTREQFEKRLAAVKEYLYPTFKPNVLASEGIITLDTFPRELALRERSNRLGILAVEADKGLAKFESYEQYLNSLVTSQDHCFLQSTKMCRTIVSLGYRSVGDTLTRSQFETRREAVMEYLHPKFRPFEEASFNIKPTEDLMKELALRERVNRLGILATIIFLRHFTKTGFEVSGYIDYGDRLVNEDWKPFFKGLKRLWPRPTDLGYYHWRIDKSVCNDSKNYKVIVDPKKGLLFQNRFDRKVLCVDPAAAPGSNSSRIRIQTELYENVVLYDHVVMQRI